MTGNINSAISREKQIKEPALILPKGWLRSKKVALIEARNPYWVDLAEEWDTNPKPPQTLRPPRADSG